MTVYEIPLTPRPQRMAIALSGVTYNLRFHFADAPEAGWILDIYDVNKNPIICGLALVTGADLLAQYAYLGIPGKLYVSTDGDAGAAPTFDGLGTTSHLYYEDPT